MNEKYPDRFISIEIHENTTYGTTDAVGEPFNYDVFIKKYTSTPTFLINRVKTIDTTLDNAISALEDMNDADAMISANAIFVTDDKTGFNITDRRISNSLMLHATNANSKEREEMVRKCRDAGYIVVFIGDSPSDLNAASIANICATTDNCFEYIKPFFHYVSKYQGGHGGFADILYQLMLMDKDDLEIYK